MATFASCNNLWVVCSRITSRGLYTCADSWYPAQGILLEPLRFTGSTQSICQTHSSEEGPFSIFTRASAELGERVQLSGPEASRSKSSLVGQWHCRFLGKRAVLFGDGRWVLRSVASFGSLSSKRAVLRSVKKFGLGVRSVIIHRVIAWQQHPLD